MTQNNALNWFEIFTNDFAASKKFYETILDITMKTGEMENCQMAFFPYDEESAIGGAISQMECGNPGSGGTIVYLNAEGKLDATIARIPAAGGKVIKERTAIPPHGFIAVLEDPEGNIVGLHSMS